MKQRAVFLDRDGVLVEPVYRADSKAHEPPYRAEELALTPRALEALEALQGTDHILLVVSNQPDIAKNKCSMGDLQQVHRALEIRLQAENIRIERFYYCYHHPDGAHPQWSRTCACRKPGSLLLETAARDYDLDLERSWMIGDRDSDIECGRRVGSKTILVAHPHSREYRHGARADFEARDVLEAAQIVLRHRPA